MRQGITLGERQAGDTACLTVRSGAVLWPHPPAPSPAPLRPADQETDCNCEQPNSPFAQSS